MAKGETPAWLYMAVHPAETLKAIALRTETKLLDDFAPTNYLGIPLVNVVKKLVEERNGKKINKETIYFKWPESTHKRLKKGQEIRPGGSHPEDWDI